MASILLLALLTQAAAPKSAPVTGAWKISTTRSAMDDSKTVTLSLSANAAVHAWPATTATPRLMLRCQEGDVEAYFALGVRLQPESDGSRILMRFDQGKPQSVGVGNSTDGLGVFFQNAAGAIANILDSKRLLIRFVPFNSNPQETSFSVSGLNEAIKPLAAACEWDVFGEIATAKAKMAAEAEKERAAVARIIQRLKTDARPLARSQAADELGIRNGDVGPEAIQALADALRDESADVRASAAEALGWLGSAATAAVPALEAAAKEPGASPNVSVALTKIQQH